MTNLHPSSILDGLHFGCLDRLKSQNRLKKGEGTPDAETPDSDVPTTQRQFSADGKLNSKAAEIKTSSYQALISLPRVSLCLNRKLF